MKTLVFDASSLISLSEKCFMSILGCLAEQKKVEFVMPMHVMRETVQVPLKIKRFELNALRIKNAIKKSWIKVMPLSEKDKRLSKKIMSMTKNLFFLENKPIQFIHKGEIEALALTKNINADALVMDERTTRMLLEEPQNLVNLFEYRHGKKISFDTQKLLELKKTVGKPIIFRSSELLAMGYEKNCFGKELEETKASLKACLFSVKYAGCAISEYEIEEYLREVKK